MTMLDELIAGVDPSERTPIYFDLTAHGKALADAVLNDIKE